MRLYSIYDSVADEFGPIFCLKSDLIAIRASNQMLMDVQEQFRKDYKVMFLGLFENGELIKAENGPVEIVIEAAKHE